MTAAQRKAPGGNPEASHSNIQPDQYITTPRGRRAIASLWNASRIVNGALLTSDDLALIAEALTEIAKAVQS